MIRYAILFLMLSCVAAPYEELGIAREPICEIDWLETEEDEGFFREVKIASPDNDRPDVNWTLGAFEQNGVINSVSVFGHNAGATGRENQAMPGLWLQQELSYETGSGVLSEIFFQWSSADGETVLRPVGAVIDWNTEKATWGLNGGGTIANSAGVQIVKVWENGHFALYHQDNSSFFYKVGNNTPVIAGTDPNGNARELMRIGADNKLYVDVGQNCTALRLHSQALEVMHEATFESTLSIGPVDVGAKLAELEARIAALE